MRINRLSVKGLHGLIDLAIDFLPDLTIIVGRNGSGKTSALTLAADLLRLDIESLKETRFQEAELLLQDEVLGRVAIEVITKSSGRLLSLRFGDENPVTLQLEITSLAQASNNVWAALGSTTASSALALSDMDRFFTFQSSVDSPWLSAARKLAERTQLTFVQLDRTIVAIDPEGTESIDPGSASRRRQRPGRAGPSEVSDPIDAVVRVLRRKYLEYRSTVDTIKDVAQRDFLRLHFSQIGPQPESSPKEKQLRLQLDELRKRVERSQVVADTPEIKDSIDRFFSEFNALLDQAYGKPQARRTGRRTLKEESIELLINFRQQQIEELLKIFDAEQSKSAEAYAPIRAYFKTARKFLEESGKVLEFSANYELGFRVPKAATMEEASLVRNLKELSSGERQVVIVLTYLAFLAGEESIFIVDEPELSLHLTWQTYLVEALQELRPRECQIILATHAPEIVGRAQKHAKVLRPDYLPMSGTT